MDINSEISGREGLRPGLHLYGRQTLWFPGLTFYYEQPFWASVTSLSDPQHSTCSFL